MQRFAELVCYGMGYGIPESPNKPGYEGYPLCDLSNPTDLACRVPELSQEDPDPRAVVTQESPAGKFTLEAPVAPQEKKVRWVSWQWLS